VRVQVCADAEDLGQAVAREAARRLRDAVAARGRARLLLSTGRSQFTTLAALVQQPVPWEAVEAFHLDEYIGIGPDHPASFRRYLRERFVQRVPLAAMHEVAPEGDLVGALQRLGDILRQAPVDVALVGVGENAHIAFNDPPADFEATAPYLVVTLAPECRAQQVGEGWFASVAEVPSRAVTMSVRQIMASRAILSPVPYAVKAPAVLRLLTAPVGPDVPASILRTHPDATLFVDRDAVALVPAEVLAAYAGEAGGPVPPRP
jgi:glucosamine-6-phosphate deaminase